MTGVFIGSSSVLVEGNFIGTDASGTHARPNEAGIGTNIGGNNTIGGTVAGAGNLVSGNTIEGIILDLSNSNLVVGNFIGTDSTGTLPLGNEYGLTVFGSSNTIGGLTGSGAGNVVSANLFDGISIASGTGNLIEGNDVGTNAAGTAALGNGALGAIDVQSGPNTVGGTTAGAGNLVSGNLSNGIYLESSASAVLVAGNIVGLSASGGAALGNNVGMEIDGTNNTIGGTTAAARNVVSANQHNGVLVLGAGNLIEGNYVGTDTAGTVAFENLEGVEIAAPSNTIGGTSAGAGNVISGNTGFYPGNSSTGFGLWLTSSAAATVVVGNEMGTNAAGTAALPNNFGVEIDQGASSNTIGGIAAGAGNVISGNNDDGVEIAGAGTIGNVVAGNLIGTDITGTVAIANGTGVEVDTAASGNTIGGTAAVARNVIAGNMSSGVLIDTANDNLVEGDFIGTDETGTVGLGNNLNGGTFDYTNGGVAIDNGSAGNTIGGLTATPGTGAGNLISGNAYAGIDLFNAGTNNLVAGNLVGTDVTGTLAVPNIIIDAAGGVGVEVDSSPDNIVGEPGGRNVISGNAHTGVTLIGSTGTTVQTNYIGTNLSGSAAVPNSSNGLEIAQSGSYTIGGLTSTPGTGLGNVISGNGIAGLTVDSNTAAGQVVVLGNIIGADATGLHELPNLIGIFLYSAQNVTIGGTAAGAVNLISGDNLYGNEGNIRLDGASSNNIIEGNLIGTDITGLGRLPALPGDVFGVGVWVIAGSTNNTIGGTTSAARNVISALTGGVLISGPTTTANVVEGNFIGTGENGTQSLGNGDGVQISDAPGNTIGGTAADAANVISFNTLDGIQITGATAAGNSVLGNLIGTDATGTIAFGNSGDGVEIDSGATDNIIGAIAAGAGNTIADNNSDGVQIVGNGTTGDAIRGNSIFGNGLLGIELGTSGVPSTNILGGSTTGPNNDENYPVLTIVSYTPGVGTTIAGNINSTPNTTVYVDFYTDTVEGQGGFGQGQSYAGSVAVTTTIDGNASFTFLSTSLPRNAIVSATATDPGNTSEFSLDQAEDTPPIAELVARPSPAGAPATTFNEGQSITFDGSGSYSPDGDSLSYTWDFNDGTPLVTTSTPTETHAYDYDGSYVVTLTVNDGHGGIESNIDILTINKLPPTITFNSLPASLAVGTTLHLSGTIDDPTPDLETVVLNWGDGSYPTTLKLPAGSSVFSASHDYTSPLPGGATTATLSATVTDASNPAASPEPSPIGPLSPTPTFDVGGLSGSTSAMLTVFQQVPTIAGLTLSQSTVSVGGTTTLSGTIVDPDPVVSHTVTIQWGDPSPNTTLVLPPGDLAFSSAHQYDSTPGNSLSGTWPIDVTVVNSNLASGSVAPPAVTAVDVAPVVQIESLPLSTTGSLVSLISIATEPPGTRNQLTYQWTLTTGGAVRFGNRPDPFVCLDQRRSVHRDGGGHRPGRRDRAGQRTGRRRPIDPE